MALSSPLTLLSPGASPSRGSPSSASQPRAASLSPSPLRSPSGPSSAGASSPPALRLPRPVPRPRLRPGLTGFGRSIRMTLARILRLFPLLPFRLRWVGRRLPWRRAAGASSLREVGGGWSGLEWTRMGGAASFVVMVAGALPPGRLMLLWWALGWL